MASLTAGDDGMPARDLRDLLQPRAAILAVSPSAEHLFTAALIDTDRNRRAALIARALAIEPANPVMLRRAIDICLDEPGLPACRTRDWERRLLAVDHQNSEAWATAALARLQNGDEETALAYLQRSAGAAETRADWPEILEIIERSLAAAGDMDFADRVQHAFGIAAIHLDSAVSDACRDLVPVRHAWALACLDYGAQVERQSRTILKKRHSFAIQRFALQALGDERALAELDLRDAAHRASVDALFDESTLPREALMMQERKVFTGYVAELRAEGEAAAIEFLDGELQRWVQENGKPSCFP